MNDIKSLKCVIFYNHYHNGDIHYSRNFCRDIIKGLREYNSDLKFYYFHSNNPTLVQDVCDFIPHTVYDLSNIGSHINQHSQIIVQKDHLFLNTWIGSVGYKFLGEEGCTLDSNIRMYREMYDQLNSLFNINLTIKERDTYLPEIEFSKFRINEIKPLPKNIVLVCNNFVASGQAPNFDFSHDFIAISEQYPHLNFILTNKYEPHITGKSNVYYIDEFISGFNLNEIGYISLNCKLIVGRNSGPFCFATNKQNYLRNNVSFVTMGTSANIGDAHLPESYWGRVPNGKLYTMLDPDQPTYINLVKKALQELI